MPDLLNVEYAQTGASTKQNSLGMREMQARVYEKRNSPYILLKAPPASGKSRAVMFLALDKVQHQGLNKVLIIVPEMSIGASFRDTELKKFGFFADWHIDPLYSLCTPGADIGKVDTVLAFLEDKNAHYLLCTHATMRFAWERLVRGHHDNIHAFDATVLAIDEFHHTSAEDGNKLGAMLDDIMSHTTAHVIAMTGSYFRGDAVPILTPEAESRFNQVTYTYYEQLNGYKHLKSLGLGYHFYSGRYFDALREVLDLSKKTIIHIPNVNSRESTGQKYNEVDQVIDVIGRVIKKDPESGILTVQAKNGKTLKVADLVSDDASRVNVLSYLRNIHSADEMDIIIALGMAKEGFDWPWCEHVLTIGYRASLTEVVQIIGRATRDCEGKTHAQFTNLIAQPDAEDQDVQNSVNNLLKAIALSLLMRDVLAPNIRFRPRSTLLPDEKLGEYDIEIDDTERPVTPRLKKLLDEGGINQVIANLLTKPEAIAPAVINNDPKTTTEVELPKIIAQVYPDLSAEEQETVKDLTKAQLAIQMSGKKKRDKEDEDDEKEKPTSELLRVADKLLHVDELNLDLIDKINPFQGAYEILSKSFDAPLLKTIQDHVESQKSTMTQDEAILLWPDIEQFVKTQGRQPSPTAPDPFERRLGEGLVFMRNLKASKMSHHETQES